MEKSSHAQYAKDKENIEKVLKTIEKLLKVIEPFVDHEDFKKYEQIFKDVQKFKAVAEVLLKEGRKIYNSKGKIAEAASAGFQMLLGKFKDATNRFMDQNEFPREALDIKQGTMSTSEYLVKIWHSFVEALSWACGMLPKMENSLDKMREHADRPGDVINDLSAAADVLSGLYPEPLQHNRSMILSTGSAESKPSMSPRPD